MSSRLRARVRHETGVDDLELGCEPAARVADLSAALQATLGGDWSQGVAVDGVLYHPETPISELDLGDGARLGIAPDAPEHRTPPVIELAGIAGTDSGLRLLLAPGLYRSRPESPTGFCGEATTIGVAADGSVTIDPGPCDQVLLDGRPQHDRFRCPAGAALQVGATVWRVRKVQSSTLASTPASTPDTTSSPGPFNRPPRRLTPEPTVDAAVPKRGIEPPKSGGLRWTMILAPLVMGGTMAIFFNPRFALFCLLSPVLMLFNLIDNRFSRRRGLRAREEKFTADLVQFDKELRRWKAAWLRRLWQRHPSLPDLVAAAASGDNRLWERRPHHDDFLGLGLGYGGVTLPPPMAPERNPEPEVIEAIDRARQLDAGPVEVQLRGGAVLGLAGPRDATTGIIRSLLVQAAFHHGPADLRLAVLAHPDRVSEWRWVSWLPHVMARSGRRLLAATAADADVVVSELEAETSGHTLVVVDTGHDPAASSFVGALVAGGTVSAIAIAEAPDRLPSLSSTVVSTDGVRLRVENPGRGEVIEGVTPLLASEEVAAEVAHSVAVFQDPERADAESSLPETVGLLELLGMSTPDPDTVAAAWRSSGSTVRAPIGAAANRTLEIDLVTDGPHGLLAGTTGAGKSELLRTMVVSLAARVDPEHLNYVLIDYKGGSAFDACAALPHVVGVVTDLDEHLARRALTCLEAELRHRERLLREVGAQDLPTYLAAAQPQHLPRLLIVIDEFAAMAKELPEFMEALVDIAARGRSLGVHLLLATQRPAGVIKDNIRANSNLRLSLRVQSTTDSKDVIGDGAAANLPRSLPGRGYVRFGPSELVPFQTALSTGISGRAGTDVIVSSASFSPEPPPAPRRRPSEGLPTDLERLVAAIIGAAECTKMRPARTPWPAPLPGGVELADLLLGSGESADGLPLGLVDQPEEQRVSTWHWDPRRGNLLCYGMPGSGIDEFVETVVVAAGLGLLDSPCHAYVLGFGTHRFDHLADLPHVGSVVAADDRERQVRLLRSLRGELERRRRSGQVAPRLLLVIDDYAGLRAAFDGYKDIQLLEMVARLIADGAALGINVIACGRQAMSIPLRVAGTVATRLAFAFADPMDFTILGLRLRNIPALPHGRAVDATTGLIVQAVTGWAEVTLPEVEPRPVPVEVMPEIVERGDMGAASISDGCWRIPVGIGEHELAPVDLVLDLSDHALVGGGPRTGKSTLLATLADAAVSLPGVTVTAFAPRRSPLRESAAHRIVTDPAELPPLIDEIISSDDPHIVLVDDADAADDPGGCLARLIAARHEQVHMIAAGRSDELRRAYNHWTGAVRKSKVGVLLDPEPTDAELLGVKLPPPGPGVRPPGRGYLVSSGLAQLVQIAR